MRDHQYVVPALQRWIDRFSAHGADAGDHREQGLRPAEPGEELLLAVLGEDLDLAPAVERAVVAVPRVASRVPPGAAPDATGPA